MTTSPNTDDIPIPALLRGARGSYNRSIRTKLAAGGFDDLPRNGPFLLGGMANRGETAGQLLRGLRVSRQAASQLVDTLVLRGYVERDVNTEDRRRMTILLTERGRAAAAAVLAGVDAVDAELSRRIAPDDLAGMRNGLLALCEIAEPREGKGGMQTAD